MQSESNQVSKFVSLIVLKTFEIIIMETNSDYKFAPTVGRSFGIGWNVMFDNFLRLFLVIIILGIITGPFKMMNYSFDSSDLHKLPYDLGFHWGESMKDILTLSSLGIFAAFFVLIGMLYAFLVVPVFDFGGDMMFVQAVRKIKPDFELLVKGFMQNYLSIVLANLLVFALGFFALIIPGIIIACRLAFVSYIVMDKKLDPIEAVELSWKLTRGHGWKIFFMGFLSIFIIIFGLILLIIGIFPAIIWISGSFAALYESVLREKEKPEVVAVV
jgi:hypothetical protein